LAENPTSTDRAEPGILQPMAGVRRAFGLRTFSLLLLLCPGAAAAEPWSGAIPKISIAGPPPTEPQILLGIDVLEANGFAAIKGKRVGLLTHPAGVNRAGVSTIDVLRRAPGVQLVALFGAEHGVHGVVNADVEIADGLDPRTGLRVFSLYNRTRKPTRAMLKGIDVFVIDLQDIGTRSFTFVSAMRRAMEGCFEHGVEVVVLDRPNPLGGLKVDGPLLDAALARNNYVGAFRVPYVHGLTIGELARMTKAAPSLDFPDEARARGKLTVIPMRGWTRSMRWPDTGLKWIPPSGGIKDFETALGYPMVGLGTYFNPASNFDIGFRHGVGPGLAFRGLTHKSFRAEALEKELRALRIPGIEIRRITAPDRNGNPTPGVYVDIVDYDAWNPTELNFHLMKLACKFEPANPFAPAPGRGFASFLLHLGSIDFLNDLAIRGAAIDLDAWLRGWREQVKIYRQQSRKYWLYQ
jgi:uncharacterized protein YbbC (DUF1343 family)